MIVRVTLENTILTYTNVRNMNIFRGSLRVESPHYSRKFGEKYYRGLGWSKAIDFTTRFGFSKGIAQALLKKGSAVTRKREKTSLITGYINSLFSKSRECFGYQGKIIF